MLVKLYVGGVRHKGSERVPTQFLNRLRVSDPTGGVPEVWRFRQILFCLLYKDN
jgi:hypothetical protein